MFKIPLPELKGKIVLSKKISPSELDARIKEKINELSGLISEEGAAHIIANELGIELTKSAGKLKIKEIYAGMRNVITLGKVTQKFEVREFSKGERSGKVASLILGDETGTLRIVFWNDQVEHFNNIKEEDILLLKEGYVKENNNHIELHLGESSTITINPTGEKIETVRKSSAYERKKIGDFQGGEENAEIVATVVQVFDPRFFNTCSRCGRKVQESAGQYTCQEHGVVPPSLSFVMNLILDDGSGTIRGVFWKNQTKVLLGQEEAAFQSYKENPSSFESMKTDLLGEQLKLAGSIKRNEMFDRLEFNVQVVEKAKPEEEIKRLEKSS